MSVTKGTKPIHLPAAEQSKRPWCMMACMEMSFTGDFRHQKKKKIKKLNSGLGEFLIY